MSSKASIGDPGMSTVGPTGEVNGGMVTGLRVEDQQGGGWNLSLGYHWEGGGVE